jgi:hypothetical protein
VAIQFGSIDVLLEHNSRGLFDLCRIQADRPGLEQLCCECYAVVKKETDRLLPLRPFHLRGEQPLASRDVGKERK